MATEIRLPQLGTTMTEGRIVDWLKATGDPVKKGEPLAEVETDKVTVEIEAPIDGVMGPIRAETGKWVEVGSVLATILAPGESGEALAGETSAPSALVPTAAAAPDGSRVAASPRARKVAEELGVELGRLQGSGPGGRITEEDVRAFAAQAAPAAEVSVSPVARRLAEELGVDLSQVQGSGPGGRVVKQDVERAGAALASRPPSTPPAAAAPAPAGELTILRGVRRVAAQRMTQSFTTAPHFYITAEVGAAALVRMREGLLAKIEATTGARLTITDILVKICAQALSEHPEVNAAWAEREGAVGVVRQAQVHIGIAVATDDGLLVPVIHEADTLRLSEIAQLSRELIQRARAGKATIADLEGGTFTISNLGMFGVDQFQAIINPPQSMILAVGRIRERPAVVDGAVVARPTLFLTLSADHRVLDGAEAARFLERVSQLIEEPYLLLG